MAESTIVAGGRSYAAEIITEHSSGIDVILLNHIIREAPSHYTFRANTTFGNGFLKNDCELDANGLKNGRNNKAVMELIDKFVFKLQFGDVDDYDVHFNDVAGVECIADEYDTTIWFGIDISKRWFEEHCSNYQEFLSWI